MAREEQRQIRTRSFSNHSGAINFSGGAQFGYNWKLSPFAVAGFETDFNYNNTKTKVNGTVALTGPLAGGSATYNITQRLDRFWHGARPRRYSAGQRLVDLCDRWPCLRVGQLLDGALSGAVLLR